MTNQTTIVYVTADTSDDDPFLAALDATADVVHRAVGVTDALKRLEDGPVDCLVSDATPSDLDVVRLVELVRERYPSLPVVLVAGADVDLAARAMSAGANHYVSDPTEVADRVRNAVAARRTKAALDDHDRLKETVRRIAGATAGAPTRTEIEEAVYDQLVATDLYLYAWIGEYDLDEDALRFRVPIDGSFDLEEFDSLVGTREPTFVAEAVDRREVVATSGTADVRSASAETGTGSGPTRTLFTAAVPLVGTDAVHGLALLSTTRTGAFDESERDRLAELGGIVGHAIERAESRPDEFAENLIHELRSPLGIAKAHLEIGRESGSDEAFEEVESALNRLEHTIENVSTLARFDGVGGVSTRDFAETASAAWAELLADGADFVVEGSRPISADHDLLERLFSNLFRNAIEHGGEDATVRIGTLDGGFYVEDDGPGVPSDERDVVFERGYSTRDGGLGIGLSIVEEVAAAHGWTVTLGEGDDGGARFEVTGVDRSAAAGPGDRR